VAGIVRHGQRNFLILLGVCNNGYSDVEWMWYGACRASLAFGEGASVSRHRQHA
jgi:hypothetical protein